MTIAQQVKSFYVEINPNNGNENYPDFGGLQNEAEERAVLVTSQDDAGITEFDFCDGSVMIINSSDEAAYIYASR